MPKLGYTSTHCDYFKNIIELESKTEHILKLATEIMDDIELSESEPQSILLKSTRLARYVDNSEIRSYLKFEIQGYLETEFEKNIWI